MNGPIEINEPTRVDAYAVQDGLPDGPVSSFQYDILTQTSVAEARSKAKGEHVWTKALLPISKAEKPTFKMTRPVSCSMTTLLTPVLATG